MFRGVRIVELSAWVMVPGAGVLMADLGAEVIKIEHPREGDPARGLVTGGKSPSVGSVNLMVEQTNRGKRSIGIDLTSEAGREILYKLVAEADIFLTSYLPPVRRKLGVDVDDLRKHNPSLIYAMADALGSQGPEGGKPGFDSGVFFARAGILSSLRVGDELPQPRPGFGDKTAALSLAFAMAGALYRRAQTGEPSVLETSLLSTAAWVASSDILYSEVVGKEFRAVERPATNPLAHRYQTADGRWLVLAMLASDRWWAPFCEALGRNDLAADERFTDARARAVNAEEAIAALQATFAAEPLATWEQRLASFRGPWEVARTSYEALTDPQLLANGVLDTVDHPSGETVRAVRTPVVVDAQPHPLEAAPEVWQHTEEILVELGFDWDQILQLKDDGVIP